MNNCGTRLKTTETNGTQLLAPFKGDLVSSSSRVTADPFPLTAHLAIHCRNRLQSLQRAKAAVEDSASPPAREQLSGLDRLPSPSSPSFSIPSPLSSSGSLTPSLLGTHLPGEEPSQGNPSTAPMIPACDGEPDCQFGLEVSPGAPQDESFHISQALQQEFPTTTPTNNPASFWQDTIPPSELWKDFPAESSMTGERVQFYQPPQVLTIQVKPPPFNNSSLPPPILFTMTCPVPHCCYQCQAVVEIWRHITWAHVRPQPDDGIEGIVEKVVLGNV